MNANDLKYSLDTITFQSHVWFWVIVGVYTFLDIHFNTEESRPKYWVRFIVPIAAATCWVLTLNDQEKISSALYTPFLLVLEFIMCLRWGLPVLMRPRSRFMHETRKTTLGMILLCCISALAFVGYLFSVMRRYD